MRAQATEALRSHRRMAGRCRRGGIDRARLRHPGDRWEGIIANVTHRAYARDAGPYLGTSEATFAFLWARSGLPRAAILLAGHGAQGTLTLMLNSLRFDVVPGAPGSATSGFWL